MSEVKTPKYYFDDIELKDLEELEDRFKTLVDMHITSVGDLENWITQERKLRDELTEAMVGHEVEFICDTTNVAKREIHMHDQLIVQPLVMKYESLLDKKFCNCPYTECLDESLYGLMRNIRRLKVGLFRVDNIQLMVREEELGNKYYELMSGLSVDWDGEVKPYSYVKTLLESTDRSIREHAWRALAQARTGIKPELNEIMDELVRTRHQIALNAGFENYRDYIFVGKNREYSIHDCLDLHVVVEKHLVPTWMKVTELLRIELNIDTYRPWDSTATILQEIPFCTVSELMDGVQQMLGETDPYFEERFRYMRNKGLLDLDNREGKGPGGFSVSLPLSKNRFVYANFGPSFFAVVALIHEMGHSINGYLQFNNGIGQTKYNSRSEVEELYSHAMELLLLDKLNIFYPSERMFKNAQREELRRAFRMLLSPVSSDMFQHWMYTHPYHTAQERDEMWFEMSKRFIDRSVDTSGLESEVSSSWIDNLHLFLVPFYMIEYTMSEIGALQLLEIYRDNAQRGIDLYKQGASANLNQSITEIYRNTGIEFDFSESVVMRTAEFLTRLIYNLH